MPRKASEKEIVISTPTPARRKPATSRAKRSVAASGLPVEAPEIPVAVTAAVEATAEERALPSRDEIAALAYSFWVARGFQGGSQESDWLRAEQELSGNLASAATA